MVKNYEGTSTAELPCSLTSSKSFFALFDYCFSNHTCTVKANGKSFSDKEVASALKQASDSMAVRKSYGPVKSRLDISSGEKKVAVAEGTISKKSASKKSPERFILSVSYVGLYVPDEDSPDIMSEEPANVGMPSYSGNSLEELEGNATKGLAKLLNLK